MEGIPCRTLYSISIDFYDQFVETIRKKGADLEADFLDEGISNNAVCYLKLLVAASLKKVCRIYN